MKHKPAKLKLNHAAAKTVSTSLLGMCAIFGVSCASNQQPAPIIIQTQAAPAPSHKPTAPKPAPAPSGTVGTGLSSRPVGTVLDRDVPFRTDLEPVRQNTVDDIPLPGVPKGIQ